MLHALAALAATLRTRLDSLSPWLAPLGLRLILAYEFGEAGVQKLRGDNWFASIQHKFPPPLGWIDTDISWLLATWTELLAALALVLGLCTRLSAYSLLMLTVVATVAVHWPSEWNGLGELWQGYAIRDTGAGNFKLPLLFALMLLPLLFGGAGRLSVDALLARPGARPVEADAGSWALAALGLGLPLALLFPWLGLAVLAGGLALLASALRPVLTRPN